MHLLCFSLKIFTIFHFNKMFLHHPLDINLLALVGYRTSSLHVLSHARLRKHYVSIFDPLTGSWLLNKSLKIIRN